MFTSVREEVSERTEESFPDSDFDDAVATNFFDLE